MQFGSVFSISFSFCFLGLLLFLLTLLTTTSLSSSNIRFLSTIVLGGSLSREDGVFTGITSCCVCEGVDVSGKAILSVFLSQPNELFLLEKFT